MTAKVTIQSLYTYNIKSHTFDKLYILIVLWLAAKCILGFRFTLHDNNRCGTIRCTYFMNYEYMRAYRIYL